MINEQSSSCQIDPNGSIVYPLVNNLRICTLWKTLMFDFGAKFYSLASLCQADAWLLKLYSRLWFAFAFALKNVAATFGDMRLWKLWKKVCEFAYVEVEFCLQCPSLPIWNLKWTNEKHNALSFHIFVLQLGMNSTASQIIRQRTFLSASFQNFSFHWD